MDFKVLSFVTLFLMTLGITTISTLLAFNMHKKYKHNFLQILLYQQIFLYSFFLYGIWGNIIITRVVADLNIAVNAYEKITFLIPIIGTPFLIISWYMLLKFTLQIKGKNIGNLPTILFFCLFGLLFISFTYLIQFEHLEIAISFNSIITRFLIILNLSVHIFQLLYILITHKTLLKTSFITIPVFHFIIYFSGIVLYSSILWFSKTNVILIFLSIFLIFIVSALPAIIIYRVFRNLPDQTDNITDQFKAFCEKYDISKREAEIIKEICSGKSNKDIADSLFISLQTVKDHTHRIYLKTGFKNRVHLVNMARDFFQ